MDLRTAVWDGWIDAQMRQRYFAALADRFAVYSTWTGLVSGIASSAAIAAWLMTHKPAVAAALTLCAAVASVLQTTLGLERKRASATLATRHWERRSRAWHTLWLEMEESAAVSTERYGAEQGRDLDWFDPELSEDAKLLGKSQRAAHHAMGLV